MIALEIGIVLAIEIEWIYIINNKFFHKMSNIAPSFKNLEFDEADSELAAPFERSNRRRNGIIISVSSK